MVVSIGPNTALATLSGQPRNQKDLSAPSAAEPGSIQPASITVRSTIAEPRREERPEVTSRTLAEERTGTALFRASSEVSTRREVSSGLEAELSQVLALAKRAEKEVDVARRQELEDEANSRLVNAQEDFNRLLNQSPSLSQAVQVSAVVSPSAAAGGSGVFEIAIAAAPSPASIGLASVSFSDPQQAIADISAARDSVRQAETQFSSNAGQLSQVVASEIKKAENQNAKAPIENTEQFASQIAAAIRTIATTDSQSVERLDVKSLLTDNEERQRQTQEPERDTPQLAPLEIGSQRGSQQQANSTIRIF